MSTCKAVKAKGLKRKWAAVSSTALFLASPLAGHAQGTPPPTLQKAKDNGFITVGYRKASVPFSYLHEQKPTGFAWEICGLVVEGIKSAIGRADIQIKAHQVTSHTRIPLLNNGTIDIECGSTANTFTRRQLADFSINYFYDGTRVLVKSSSDIKDYAALKGRRVVSMFGSNDFQAMCKLNVGHDIGFELLPTEFTPDPRSMLQENRIDALAMGNVMLHFLRAKAPHPEKFEIIGDPIFIEPYAIMLRKDDPTFKKLVDDTLARLMTSGEFESLYRKWFLSPIPPMGVNLNIPMSKDLADNLKALSDRPSM